MEKQKNSRRTETACGLRRGRTGRCLTGYAFLLPFLLLFLLFIAVPVVWGLFISFTSYDLMTPVKWVGLENYITLFTEDGLFLTALKNTFTFALISGPLGFLASFAFAWIIHQLHLRNLFAMAFYVPSIMSSLAVSVVWLSLFSSNRTGIVNHLLLKLRVISEAVSWTMDPEYIMPLIILISVWMSMGTGFLTSLAGLSGIDEKIYEAGRIDGVRNRFQELFLLTLPQMKPQLLFNGIMAVVNSLNVYDLVTQIAGAESPDNCALTLTAHMYDYGFVRFELGYASAISVVLMLVSVVLGQIVKKLFAVKE